MTFSHHVSLSFPKLRPFLRLPLFLLTFTFFLFFWDRVSLSLPSLECSGVISAHYILRLLSSSDSLRPPSDLYIFEKYLLLSFKNVTEPVIFLLNTSSGWLHIFLLINCHGAEQGALISITEAWYEPRGNPCDVIMPRVHSLKEI